LDSDRQTVFFPGPDAVIANGRDGDTKPVVPFAWPDNYWWGDC
jgi:hypothetical protein